MIGERDFKSAITGVRDTILRLAGWHPLLTVGIGLLGAFAIAGALSVAMALFGMAVLALAAVFWPWASASLPRALDRSGLEGEDVVDGGALWQSVLDGMHDLGLLLDRNCNLIAFNARADAPPQSALGRHISHWKRTPALLRTIEDALDKGEQRTSELREQSPVKRSAIAMVTPLPSRARPGAPALLITFRDLTGEDQLSRLRADFVANASHELRTPLASLKGFVETLQGAAKDDAEARVQFLKIMQQQADRMSRLIEDLLSLSRIEMREHVAPTSVADLGAVAEEAIRALEAPAADAGIALERAIEPGEWLVHGERDHLVQVAQNLIQNAVKYGRRGGKVSVSICREGGRIAFAVKDDGIGIAPEHLPRLTERFYRVSAKESRERGGTGLGLAIVKHIVNRHRGELRIRSTVGVGSSFTVLLPPVEKTRS